MSSIPDPIALGLPKWKVLGGPHGALPAEVTVDVAIVGSGAGGGITAELLSKAGLSVLVIEEGPLRSSRDFKQRESEAYPALYQEAAARKTADKAMNILQGRCVGGSTTVNWTSSFRTPDATLNHWVRQHGLKDYTPEQLAPWFAQAEQRLSMSDWLTEANPNNDVLARGMAKLGLPHGRIRRNVKGCWNLGSCGLGCPTNAKQSMLVTTLPAALDAGAQLFVQTRVERLVHNGKQVQQLECLPVDLTSAAVAGTPCRVTAKHVVVAGGAINSPALLLRSELPNPYAQTGRRTFLHPSFGSRAVFAERIEGWQGAPQSVYSDHYLDTQPIDGPLGFKLEVPPMHPLLIGVNFAGFGQAFAQQMAEFPHTQVVIALLRDGFQSGSPGGQVRLKGDGSPELDYPITDAVWDGVRRGLLAMAEIQFAAGARNVMPLHEQARPYASWAEAKAAIADLPMQAYLMHVGSAHVMGGCSLSPAPELGVVRPDGVHWQIENLSVHDGSLFPTSIGANPQLSIYGIVTKLATQLAQRLNGRDPSA
jgi:choline dehydrogenase-like flavoprotein